MRTLLAIFLFCGIATAQDRSDKFQQVCFYSGLAVLGTSTAMDIQSGHGLAQAGYIEKNALGGTWGQIAVSGAVAVAGLWLQRHGTRASRWIGTAMLFGAAAAHGYGAAHNWGLR